MAKKITDSLYDDLNHIETLVQKEHEVGEVLEFVNAAKEKCNELEDQIDDLNSDITSLEDDVKNAERDKDDAESETESLRDELKLQERFRGIDEIRWEANNLMDNQVMQAVQEAFGKYTHIQILEKLK